MNPYVRRATAVTTALLLTAALGACGGDEGGPPTINLYYSTEQNLQKVVDNCNREAGGRYEIAYRVLPRAAEDDSMDILGLDVTWTQEFASAKWIREWTGEHKAQAEQGTLSGPLESAKYSLTVVLVKVCPPAGLDPLVCASDWVR